MAMSSMRQLLTILLTFVSRTAFIYTLGAEYLGLNGLFPIYYLSWLFQSWGSVELSLSIFTNL